MIIKPTSNLADLESSAARAKSLADNIARLFAVLPQVQAIALGGSRASGDIDLASDIDLYVFTRQEIALSVRQAIVEASGGASAASLGLTFWGPGDEWYDAQTGIEVDIVYFDAAWFEDQLRRVWVEHQAGLGYTTSLWRTVRQSDILHDPQGWFAHLQEQSQQDYPEPLRQNIIALNHPVLRSIIPSYYHQIVKAIQRSDLVSINHRLAGLLTSYFDVLFAINRVLHPGEKRLASFALAQCSLLPENFSGDLQAVLATAGDPAGIPEQGLLAQLTNLLDHLDELLKNNNFSLQTEAPHEHL